MSLSKIILTLQMPLTTRITSCGLSTFFLSRTMRRLSMCTACSDGHFPCFRRCFSSCVFSPCNQYLDLILCACCVSSTQTLSTTCQVNFILCIAPSLPCRDELDPRRDFVSRTREPINASCIDDICLANRVALPHRPHVHA